MIQEQERQRAGQDVISASCDNCGDNYDSDCARCVEIRVKEKCSKHPTKDYSNFCKKCEQCICGDCHARDHQSHEFETLSDAYRRNVDELDNQKATLEELRDRYKVRKNEVKETMVENLRKIKDHQSDLHSRFSNINGEIKRLCNGNENRLKEYQTRHESWENEEQNKLSAKESEITRIISTCSTAKSYKLSFLVRHVQQNRNREDLNLSPSIVPDLPIVISTQLRVDELQNHLGKIIIENDDESSSVLTFPVSFPAKGIKAQGTNKVWIGSMRDPDLQQFYITGDPIITAKTNCKVSSFTFVNSTEILLCDQYNRSILRKSLVTGKIETIVQVDDSSVPKGICINGNDEIVITQCFGLSGCVLVYSMDGRKEKTISTDSRTNDYIFVEPIEIVYNAAVGYCVLDAGKQVVIAISENGIVRWRYKGRLNDGAKFKPKALCCDERNNILVSNKNTVELIDKDGKFITSILTEDDGIENIWGLSYDESQYLWVGGQKFERGFLVKNSYDIIQRYTYKEYMTRREKNA